MKYQYTNSIRWRMTKSSEVDVNAQDVGRVCLWQNIRIGVHVANADLPNLSGPMTPRNKPIRHDFVTFMKLRHSFKASSL